MRPAQAFWIYIIAIICITSLLIFSGYSITSVDNASTMTKGKCATHCIILIFSIILDIILIVKFLSGDFIEDCTVEERRTISPIIPIISYPSAYLDNNIKKLEQHISSLPQKINSRYEILEID